MEIDPMALRTVMGRFPTGVAVVSSVIDGTDVAMTANAIASVSLIPPLLVWCAERTSSTLAGVRASNAFALSFLHDEQEEIARRFSTSGPKSFEGIEGHREQTGSFLMKDCIAWIDCTVEAVYEGGDHKIVIGRILAAEIGSERPPLLFYRSGYHSLAP